MLLIGEYASRLDAKNRLVIPSKIRELIDVTVEGTGWFLVPGYDGTISLYTPAEFERQSTAEKSEFRRRGVRSYDRLRFPLSAHAEMDRLGRILVPETILRRTGIGKDLVVIGVRDHLEVWDVAKWEAFVEGNFRNYDEVAEKAYETDLEDRRKSSS